MRSGRIPLAVALVFAVLIGGSDAGRYVAAIRFGLTVLGAVMVLIYLLRAPANHDGIDKLVLGALVVFLLACAVSSMPRISFDAATTATAFAATFFVARGAVADKDGRRLATSVLGLTGCLFSGFFLFLWGTIWLRWIEVAGTAPPFDLILPATPYRHQYLVGMLAALLLPATIQLARRPIVWPLGIFGTGASAAVAIMSGSRTVWLGGVLAAVVCLVLAGRRRPPRMTRRWIAAGILSVPVLVVVAAPIFSRLAAGATVGSRLGIWDASIRRWLESPLVGFGPGTFAPQLSLSGYYQQHEGLVPHGHNAIVQLLVEAGLLGILIVAIVVAVVVIAARRNDVSSIAPIAGVTFFAGASLTDNPSIIPYLVLPAIVWAALAMPRQASAPVPVRRWTRILSAGMAAGVGAACLAIVLAASVYESASAAATTGESALVVDRLAAATMLDPANALYWRDDAVWKLAAGRLDDAEASALNAVRLNPADDAAWRAAAIIALRRDQSERAITSAELAVRLRGTDPLNQLTLAYVARTIGDEATQRGAMAATLQTAPWIAATEEWQQYFGDVTSASLLVASELPISTDDPDLRAVAWLPALAGRHVPGVTAEPVFTAQTAIIDCDLPGATHVLQDMPRSDALTVEGLLTGIMLARASGADETELLMLATLRYRTLAFIAGQVVRGVSPLSGPAEDPTFYGHLSLPPPNVEPTLPISESGLSAWLHDPVAAARIGAPDSGLANCQPVR